MLAGPDLLVVLAIAFIVIGPKKLPDLAKTIGKALAEFRKTTEEIKDTIGIKELGGLRSSLTGMDLLTDLAEKVSATMTNKKAIGDLSIPAEDSVQGRVSSPAEASIPIGNGKELEKERNAKSEGLKGEIPR